MMFQNRIVCAHAHVYATIKRCAICSTKPVVAKGPRRVTACVRAPTPGHRSDCAGKFVGFSGSPPDGNGRGRAPPPLGLPCRRSPAPRHVHARPW